MHAGQVALCSVLDGKAILGAWNGLATVWGVPGHSRPCFELCMGDDSMRGMTKVFANGRSILHAGDGLKHTAAAPDVCKTPSPGGPIPVPYVNVASDSDLAEGTKTVHIEGNSVAISSSNLSTSMGDEPGTAGGGLISSKTKGKLTWGACSIDVKFEGKGVVRFMDATLHNGNSFNTAFMSQGGTGFAYGDDFEGVCPICQKDPDKHAVLELKEEEQSFDIANKILKDLKAREAELAQVNQDVISKKAELTRLEEQDPKPKQSTLDVRKKAIEDLEQKSKKLEDHRREKSGMYMFGVLVCVTGKKFAAVSGNEVPKGFEAIAESHGCKVIKEAATLKDFQAINPRCKAKDAAEAKAAADRIEAQWEATTTKYEEEEEGYDNRPGTCAGAKLIGKSGHVARSMTEIYFSFSKNKKGSAHNVIYRGPIDYAPSLGHIDGAPSEGSWTPPDAKDVEKKKNSLHVEERFKMKRKKDDTFLSCKSCQDTLFMARCNHEEQKCKG